MRAAFSADELPRLLRAEADRHSGDTAAVILALGLGTARGRMSGTCIHGGRTEALDSVSVIDSGMPLVTRHPATLEDTERWSRSIGALGEQAWRRLQSLSFAIVGCGRSGSLIASALSRAGVREILAIDPDRVDPHNIGEMESISPRQIGFYKAHAHRDSLGGQSADSQPRFRPVPAGVLSLEALIAIKSADALVCCVDNSAARLATDFLAELYLKPLLDIGTGIVTDPSRPGGRRIGADVRFVIPGRCLSCLGGVNGVDQARAELLDASRPYRGPALADWRTQRAGSLHSLNQIAVGFGLRMIEEFLSGRSAGNTWLRLDYDESGTPAIENPAVPAPRWCHFCDVTARGDAGIPLLSEALAA